MIQIDLITKERQQTTRWSGGITTQIAIYPKDSNYVDREFLWRLSTALVEIEESNFTKLTGYDRHLMVLEGKLELIHKDHHAVILEQYEQDSFKGGWDTLSCGKAKDFNLMLKEGVKGRMERYLASAGQEIILNLDANRKQGFFACYSHKGNITINAAEHSAKVEEGELLQIEYRDKLHVVLENKGSNECNFIVVFIEL
ncbi:MAG: hypothetical protein K0Q99_605 [Clostridia bacterium]|jgi:environmental stress-induced protein Ves|nr:hypothetical protein [Clostridia bacterium]